MQLNPAVLSDARILAAYTIFFASYFVFALGKFPGMKIDRPGAAIIGAVLMVGFRIMSAQEPLITRTMDPRLVYDEVAWGLLVLFIGLFIIVGGQNAADLPKPGCDRLILGTCIASGSTPQ